jgi:hypothetical protein
VLYRPTSQAAIRTEITAQTTAAMISSVRTREDVGIILDTKASVEHWPRLRFLQPCRELLKCVLFSAEAVAIRMVVGLMNLVRQLFEPILEQCQEQRSLVVAEHQGTHRVTPAKKHGGEQIIASIRLARELGIEAHDRLRVVEPKLCVANILLMAHMPKFPALQATPLLTTAVVTDLEPHSVWGGVRILDELLHDCLPSHQSDYRSFLSSVKL